MLEITEFERLLKIAGKLVGVGDFRPGKGRLRCVNFAEFSGVTKPPRRCASHRHAAPRSATHRPASPRSAPRRDATHRLASQRYLGETGCLILKRVN